jgi:hypothetical protein
MTTFGQKFQSDVEQSIQEMQQLAIRDYEAGELKDLIAFAGTKLELFLKSVVFPSISSRGNLVSFINELLNHGFVQAQVDILHELRLAYNSSKHDPNYAPTVLTTLELMRKVEGVVRDLVGLNLGITSNYARTGYKRVFWIAAWDHYIGGDTEIHIILPGESESWLGPPSLDIIYIDISSWATVKLLLSQVGELRLGKGLIPEQLYKVYEGEEDFLGALVFEGDYRDLIAILAQHERRNELLPMLMRHADQRAMLQAFILATIDVALSTVKQIQPDVAEEIKHQAISVYAVPGEYKGLDYFASSMADILFKLHRSSWGLLTGPTWIKASNYDTASKQAIAIHKDFKLFIDQSCTFRVIET